MTDESRPSGDELIRHARRHLESLAAAGIDWLPDGPPPARPAAAAEPPASVQAGLWSAGAAPGVGPASSEDRRQALEVLAEKAGQCTRCPALASSRTQAVFGVGPLDAELCFVGEAPGADEDRLGEPFVGAAGQLLDRIIAACGMKRQDVYICNILRCRPPGNRTPAADEAANCREYLEGTLELVRPKFICALGAVAATNLLGVTASIGRLRGRFHDYRGIPVLATYHPAYLLRNPGAKRDVWEDMKQLLVRMGRPVP